MMNNRLQPLFIAFAVVLGMWIGKDVAPNSHPWRRTMGIEGRRQTRLLHVFNRVEDLYVDSSDMSRLVDVAIEAMLEELDPHTEYFTERNSPPCRKTWKATLKALGWSFDSRRHLDGGDAHRWGAFHGGRHPGGRPNRDRRRRGHFWIRVGQPARDGAPERAQDQWRSALGPAEPFEVRLTRGRIPIHSVGVVRRRIFRGVHQGGSVRPARRWSLSGPCLHLPQGAGVVVDLRGNGGGYLNAVVDMLDWFERRRPRCIRREIVPRPTPPGVMGVPALALGCLGGRRIGVGE